MHFQEIIHMNKFRASAKRGLAPRSTTREIFFENALSVQRNAPTMKRNFDFTSARVEITYSITVLSIETNFEVICSLEIRAFSSSKGDNNHLLCEFSMEVT